eukprot:COSAG02_NODE_498_length_21087_cov_33.272394_11_plen_571_part_00
MVPPRSGDTTFQLWHQAERREATAEAIATDEVNLARAEELLLLHCATGALSQRAIYLLFTFWRITDVESVHLDHPALQLNPELQSPGRVFSALAAGVRGASHAALRWSPSALADLCRCITSPVWERLAADAVEREDSACREAIARQPWARLLVTILVNGVLSSTVTPGEASEQQRENDVEGHVETVCGDEATARVATLVPELPGAETLLDAHILQQNRTQEAVERRRKQRAEALRNASGMTSTLGSENANTRWDGGPITHESYQSLYALRWLCRHDGLAKQVVEHADATLLLHHLAERALRPQRFSGPGCSCGRRFHEENAPSCVCVSDQASSPADENSDADAQYWEAPSAPPAFDQTCHFCGLGTSQRLDDIFSVLTTFMLLDNPDSTRLKGALLYKLLDRAEMLVDASRYMEEVSATDYDDWQFGMMAALLPRVYDQGWVYASHGCEESSFIISVAVASIDGSQRAGDIITKMLRNATTESHTGILSLLISLNRFHISSSRGSHCSQTFKHVILGLLQVMQPFVDLVIAIVNHPAYVVSCCSLDNLLAVACSFLGGRQLVSYLVFECR